MAALIGMLALLCGAAAANDLGAGHARAEFLPADIAFKADAWLEGDQLVAVWTAEPGYYLYEHSFGVVVDGTAVEPLQFEPGLLREDDWFGEVMTHEDQVFLYLDAPNGAQTVVLRHQGCAVAGLCYPPKTTTITLPAPPAAPTAANP